MASNEHTMAHHFLEEASSYRDIACHHTAASRRQYRPRHADEHSHLHDFASGVRRVACFRSTYYDFGHEAVLTISHYFSQRAIGFINKQIIWLAVSLSSALASCRRQYR